MRARTTHPSPESSLSIREKRTKTITYSRIDDDLREEPAERICAELYDLSDNALLELHPYLYNTLLDDEDPPIATVTSPTADEGDGTITFAVTLRGGASQPTVLTYETADGTAQASSDYTSRSGTLTFPAETTGPLNVSVPIINDTLDEPNENFKLLVLAGSEKLAEGTGTIVDNDGAPLLSVADVRADEDNTDDEIEFTVRLSGVSARQVTVDYRTVDGTATAPHDYTAKTGSLTFDPGDREMKIPVTIYDDSAYEGNETLTLTLSNALNAEFSRQTATGTIVDDERAPSLSVADATAPEDDGTVEFEVTLASQVDSEVTVDYATVALTSGSNRAAEGTDCFVSGDYEDTSDTLTFSVGDVSGDRLGADLPGRHRRGGRDVHPAALQLIDRHSHHQEHRHGHHSGQRRPAGAVRRRSRPGRGGRRTDAVHRDPLDGQRQDRHGALRHGGRHGHRRQQLHVG